MSRARLNPEDGPTSSMKGNDIDTYVILRRGGWRTAEELQEAAARSAAEGDRMSDDIRWIRSYVTTEPDGGLGTVCIYQASSPEAIRTHADRSDLPVDEIVAVADTVIVRPDPAPVETVVTTGLTVWLEAKAGKEEELASFLRNALPLVDGEPQTIAWFAARTGASSFTIIDAFPDEAGRQAHLDGRVAAALLERASELLSEPPEIHHIEVLAAKLPAASRTEAGA